MATIRMKSTSLGLAASRSQRLVPAPLRPRVSGAPRTRAVVVKAADQEDYATKAQEKLNAAVKFVQEKWEETSDAEKPAAVAIVIGVIVAQIAIGATVDAVDRIPLIRQFLEFVGLAVTGVYGYRYFTDPSERENVAKSFDSFVKAVTGK